MRLCKYTIFFVQVNYGCHDSHHKAEQFTTKSFLILFSTDKKGHNKPTICRKNTIALSINTLHPNLIAKIQLFPFFKGLFLQLFPILEGNFYSFFQKHRGDFTTFSGSCCVPCTIQKDDAE